MSHRSPGNTNCSISIAKKTLRQAQKLAATERRTFSNYVTLLLEREIRHKGQENYTATVRLITKRPKQR